MELFADLISLFAPNFKQTFSPKNLSPLELYNIILRAYISFHKEQLDSIRVCGPSSVLKVTVGAKNIGVRYFTATCLFSTTPRPILGHIHPPNRRGIATVSSIGIVFSGEKRNFLLISRADRLARPPVQ